MKQILFSGIGTSDPVRSEHDGPMMHILRRYRPEQVYLFLTAEMSRKAAKDDRLEKAREWICGHWGGYQPVFHIIESDVERPQDIDALDGPMHEALARIVREQPDAEILINVSSGTPQMMTIFSQMAMDMRYRARGIQVDNPEKGAGTTERTNSKDYDVELELECNSDEEPGYRDRCVEPQMYAVRREYLRRQIVALLDRRDFEAVEQLKDELPEELSLLAQHLAARARLQGDVAQRLAGQLKGLPFQLYPYRTGPREEYRAVSEYYLLMMNLVKAGSYTEFLLHMEPLTLTLQLATLDKLLQGSTAVRIGSFIQTDRKGRLVFDPEGLRAALPGLYQHYAQEMRNGDPGEGNKLVSTYLCGVLLSYFPNVPSDAARLFAHYDALKDLRNKLAHRLSSVTADEIRAECGATPAQLLEEIKSTVKGCYPACDPVIFSVYDRCIDYIKKKL